MTPHTGRPEDRTGHADPDAIERRVRGTIRYTVDVALEGMVHAALVRSPVPAGWLRDIEVNAAAGAPGVLRVVSAADLRTLGLADQRFGTIVPDQPILADDRVRHAGEPVAAVIAATYEDAVAAAGLVRLRIEEAAPLLDPDEALAPGAPFLHDERPGNVLGRWGYTHGDIDAALRQTAYRFEGEYSSPSAQQVTFEPQACVARWTDAGLEAWAATQSPSRVAAELARVFGIDGSMVRLHVPPLGGGYGAKNHAKLEPLTAALARLARRPVRLVNSRAEEFVTTSKHPARVHLESGVDPEGRFTFRRARIRWSAGAYAHSSPAVMRAGALAVCGPYRIPAADVDSVMVYTNLPPSGSFRGLGANQGAWAGERQVDEIAAALGLDPIEFRRRNVVRSGDRLATGERVDEAHWLECLETAAAGVAAADHAAADDEPPASGDAGHEPVADARAASPSWRRPGTGIALAMKHTMTPSRSEAVVAALPDGTIEVRSSLVDMGQGLRTVLARAAARTLGLPEARVRVIDPDTALTPFDPTTSSSRGAWAGTVAVSRAAVDLRGRLLAIAAGMLEAPPEVLRLAGDTVHRVETPDAHLRLTIGALVDGSGQGEVTGAGVAVNEAPVDESGVTASSSHWHQGAVAVRADVDVETGVVTIEEVSAAAWAGRVVDQGRARLQNEGGIVMGVGVALWEELGFPGGLPGASTLLDYRIPSILDLPHPRTTALESGDPDAEPNGLGESVIPAVAPAIAGAIADATGGRPRTLPMSPERVLDAIERPERGLTEAGAEAAPAVVRATAGGEQAGGGTRIAPVAAPRDALVPIELTVDGRSERVIVDPLTPLRAVLADQLRLRSVRGPCGVGVCGACTVLVDGVAVRSCLRPVGLAAGASVLTAEGLPDDDRVVAAFVREGAAQCGSCIPGAVLAAHDRIRRGAAAGDAAIHDALAGNLCRCGSYRAIVDAVRAVSDA